MRTHETWLALEPELCRNVATPDRDPTMIEAVVSIAISLKRMADALDTPDPLECDTLAENIAAIRAKLAPDRGDE